MSDKRMIREVFEQKINIESIHNNILKKIEKQEKKRHKRYAIVPIGIILLGFILSWLLYNRQIEYPEKESQEINNIIYINNIVDNSAKYMRILDVDGRVVTQERDKMISLFPFIKNVKIPMSASNIKMSEVYASSNFNSQLYHTLIGYHLGYLESDYENKENGKSISIFFSKTSKSRGRCTPILEEQLKESIIENTPVKIGKYYNEYIVLFRTWSLYFDIEAKNITETELIEMIISILGGITDEK